jgi:hypothetical protein
MQTDQPYNFRKSTTIKTLVSKLAVTEVQALQIYSVTKGAPVRPPRNRKEYDFEVLSDGVWLNGQLMNLEGPT